MLAKEQYFYYKGLYLKIAAFLLLPFHLHMPYKLIGRSDRNRTYDLLLPKQLLYQAELHSVTLCTHYILGILILI